MTRFVQIGNQAFNPDQVTEVYFPSENSRDITVYFAATNNGEQAHIVFKGDDRDAFLAWWRGAEVYATA